MMKWWSAIAGLALESAGVWLVMDHTGDLRTLVGYLIVHVLASALLAEFVVPLLPKRYLDSIGRLYALVFAFAFFIPILGLVGLLVTVVVVTLFPIRHVDDRIETIESPEFVLTLESQTRRTRRGSLRTTLLDEAGGTDFRVKSLGVLQQMPSRTAGPILRRLLGDPNDDVRLVAYAMIDSHEKRINALIEDGVQHLKSLPSGPERLKQLRQVAELHWELVYGKLVQGDLRTHALDQAFDYIEGCLAINQDQPGLWLLRGRVTLARGDAKGATESIEQSIKLGLPLSRALPYLAEVAFEHRDFERVELILANPAFPHRGPGFRPILRYWKEDVAA